MKWIICTFIAVLLLPQSLVAQKMYSWVDEKGTKHFSDSPPPGDVYNSATVKEKSTIKRPHTSHYLYRLNNDAPYCGERKIPADETKNSKETLITALKLKKDTNRYMQSLQDRLENFRNKKKSTKSSQQFQDKLITKIDECECLLNWADDQIQKLESVKNQIILEARQAQTEYNQVLAICGDKPAPGTYTNQEVINWAECEKEQMKERNKLRKKKNSATSLENSLLNHL